MASNSGQHNPSCGPHPASRIPLLTVFAIAMGLLEAIVVIYLRQLYYPFGFDFPLTEMTPKIAAIELLREAATLVMLLSIAILTGKTGMQRFAWFLYTFAIWDIVYYLGLKWLIGWPASIMTWDILFLIPVIWVGPVLAPVICSITMILLAICLICYQEKGSKPVMNAREWLLIILGALLIFVSFIYDYSALIIKGGYLWKLSSLSADTSFQLLISTYSPTWFNWYLFGMGELLILTCITFIVRRGSTIR